MLIRHSSHGNDISVVHFLEAKKIRKATLNPMSHTLLSNEMAGLKWYSRKSKLFDSKLVAAHKHGNYFAIEFPTLSGASCTYNRPVADTFPKLIMAFEHYISVWPRQKTVPCHGDLTLDNILFDSNSAAFCDWEHFGRVGEIWGFDLLYLVLSAISLPAMSGLRISNRDIDVFYRLLKLLHEYGVPSEVLSSPFEFFCRVFDRKQHWREIVMRSPRKLYPMIVETSIRERLEAPAKHWFYGA